jgi:signal transduction histidine kinase
VEVLRRGEPLLLADLPDDDIRRMCVDEEHFELIRALGTRSALVVPLIARGQTLAALTMASASPGRRYGPADLELARELSHRAALAIDNARLYRDAQRAIRLRDDFLSVASHELNTPLTSLMLSLQGLLRVPAERRLEPATVGPLFQLMARQGERLTRLVSELLDVSRIQADLLSFQFREGADLVEVVQNVVARTRPDLERAACPVVVRGPARVLGRWDRSRLEQVVTNLLCNAIKFGPGKPIEIFIGEEAGFARFSVTDHGMGMDLSQQRRLFERFARGVSPDHYGGLGLGLYISSCIVAAHGGSIQAASQPGAGATFTVEIPHAPPAEEKRA